MEVVMTEVTVRLDSTATFEPEALERMHSLIIGFREDREDVACDGASDHKERDDVSASDWLEAPFSEEPIWKVYDRLPVRYPGPPPPELGLSSIMRRMPYLIIIRYLKTDPAIRYFSKSRRLSRR
jgi:hypothetical protein